MTHFKPIALDIAIGSYTNFQFRFRRVERRRYLTTTQTISDLHPIAIHVIENLKNINEK